MEQIDISHLHPELYLRFWPFCSAECSSPHGGNLKRRLKQECIESSQGVGQHSVHVPGRRRQEDARIGSVVRLLCLALVAFLVFVGLAGLVAYMGI